MTRNLVLGFIRIGITQRDLNDGPVHSYIGWTAEAHIKGLVVGMELFITIVNKTY